MENIIDYIESRLSYYRAYTGTEYARNTERSKIANEMYNRIRAEALKDAGERACSCALAWLDGCQLSELMDAILAGEGK
jgi:hypothetical protein